MNSKLNLFLLSVACLCGCSRAVTPNRIASGTDVTLAIETSPAQSNAAALGVKPGNEDEEAWGPASFAVLGDEIVIADAVKSRLAFFGMDGSYRRETRLPFAADRVRINDQGQLVVRDRAHGAWVTPTGSPAAEPATDSQVSVSVTSADGVISRRLADGSLRKITIDSAEAGAVASLVLRQVTPSTSIVEVQFAGPGDVITISRRLRQYDRDGAALWELADLRGSSSWPMIDDLQVAGGHVLQMQARPHGLVLRKWKIPTI